MNRSFIANVNPTISAATLDNAAEFTSPFFDSLTSTSQTVSLTPQVTKTYSFPTFYAEVATTTAVFPADYKKTLRLLPVGLKPRRIVPGKAAIAISTYHYGKVRGMTPYNEVAVAVLLDKPHDDMSDDPHVFVLAMPVTSRENRERGHVLWGLPKDVRPISFQQVGDDLVTSIPSFSLRVPMQGTASFRDQRVTLHSLLNGQIVQATSLARAKVYEERRPWAVLGAISGEARRLTLHDGPEADLLRRLEISPRAVRTSYALGVESAFGLPRL